MGTYPEPLPLNRVRVFPLATKESLNSLDKVLINPSSPPATCSPPTAEAVAECAAEIRKARETQASVILMYGAHLVKNGAMAIVNDLIEHGWVTHLATNGAGTIHDWEFAFAGKTEESVRKNVAAGKFGTWDETGRYIQIALLAGGLQGEGYGKSLGKFIFRDGTSLPSREAVETWIRTDPANPLTGARSDLLQAMITQQLSGGDLEVKHPYKASSILAKAYEHKVGMTVHPGIGYDIIATHPMFNGAVVGRAAAADFALFSRAVEGLDGGVVLSVGSAIMAPQVFEKSLSCVNNLRLQAARPTVSNHSIYVVDIQDGGNWDWSQGEPPKSNPAYYLRFCKSYARMGGAMNYVQSDNVVFLHNLLARLER